jgi:hypothetical protein
VWSRLPARLGFLIFARERPPTSASPAGEEARSPEFEGLGLALALSAAGLAGITFAKRYPLLLVCAGMMGFALLSAGPIGFQYGAEVAYPAPEGTTNGLLLMVGQISGIIFILGMDQFKVPGTGSMSPSLVVLIGLLALGALLATRLRESALITGREPSN